VRRITGVPANTDHRGRPALRREQTLEYYLRHGITQHSHGTDNVMAIANLALLTGNIGKTSTGVIRSGAENVQGACDRWLPA